MRLRFSTVLLLFFGALFVYYVPQASSPHPPSPPALRKGPHLLSAPFSSSATAAGSVRASVQAYGCRLPSLRLAIFQEAWFHTEIFGFLMEFAMRCGHQLTIYHSANHPTGAVPVYRRIFSAADPDFQFEVRDTALFRAEHSEYDAVFLTTPNDGLPPEFAQSQVHRFVYIFHITVAGFVRRWQLLRLHMSPLVGVPYTLPVYAARLPPVPGPARSKTVVMVGAVFNDENHSVQEVNAIADGLAKLGYTFKLFARHVNAATQLSKSVENVVDASTDLMFETVRNASFVVIFASFESWYHEDRVTGAIPLAFSAGTPMLVRSRMADIYGFSPQTTGTLHAANTSHLVEQVAALTQPQFAQLVETVGDYRERILLHNIKEIDNILLYVPAVNAKAKGTGQVDVVPPATLAVADTFPARVIPRKDG